MKSFLVLHGPADAGKQQRFQVTQRQKHKIRTDIIAAGVEFIELNVPAVASAGYQPMVIHVSQIAYLIDEPTRAYTLDIFNDEFVGEAATVFSPPHGLAGTLAVLHDQAIVIGADGAWRRINLDHVNNIRFDEPKGRQPTWVLPEVEASIEPLVIRVPESAPIVDALLKRLHTSDQDLREVIICPDPTLRNVIFTDLAFALRTKNFLAKNSQYVKPTIPEVAIVEERPYLRYHGVETLDLKSVLHGGHTLGAPGFALAAFTSDGTAEQIIIVNVGAGSDLRLSKNPVKGTRAIVVAEEWPTDIAPVWNRSHFSEWLPDVA